ncbi:hypothetical protein [Desulfocicer niacini]
MHLVEGKIKWAKDHWEVDAKGYGLVKVELYSPEKHPELVMNNDTWERYLQTDGKDKGSRERALQVFRRDFGGFIM